MTNVCDWLCYIKQQIVVETNIGVGGKSRRRPVLPAVAHVPFGQAGFQTLQEEGPEFLCKRKRGLLVPQIAKVVQVCWQPFIVKEHVGLLWAADPVDARRL